MHLHAATPSTAAEQLERTSPRAAASPSRGQAREPLHAGTDLTAVPALHAAAGLALRQRLELGALVLLPPVAVRVVGDEVIHLGLPLLRGVLGLEWRLPGPP